MFPKRGIQECGIAPNCLFLYRIRSVLVVRGAEPHLGPVGRAVLPNRANSSSEGVICVLKTSDLLWRAQPLPVWGHGAVPHIPVFHIKMSQHFSWGWFTPEIRTLSLCGSKRGYNSYLPAVYNIFYYKIILKLVFKAALGGKVLPPAEMAEIHFWLAFH